MRACASLFNELRNSVFATVSQAAIRRVALETFEHVLHRATYGVQHGAQIMRHAAAASYGKLACRLGLARIQRTLHASVHDRQG
jgi:hypothetical protein